MAEEVRAFASQLGPVIERPDDGGTDLAAACPPGGSGLVLRPKLARSHFATNTGDRNALIIYESAVVVGLPVALISAVAWPWYGETTVHAVLESFRCAQDAVPMRLEESFRLRSEGRGLIRGQTVRDAQADACLRAVARELVAHWWHEQGAAKEGVTTK